MSASTKIVVCDGDQTGQELLVEALRVLEPDVIGFDVELIHYDLSLASREKTNNGVVRDAAAAMSEIGLGLKAATITPEAIGSVGSPNRILREGIDGKVIVRVGRPIPGVAPVLSLSQPLVVIRMAVGDAYGAKEGRDGEAGSTDEAAWRTERIDRATCTAVAEYSFQAAASMKGIVYGGPKWTVSPTYEGMLKEEMDAAAKRHPDITYKPVLIDAAYAGLMTERFSTPVIMPSLNRDGDVLSDLVLAMFGSIAGAESVLLSLDENLNVRAAMAEAPHGTAPSLEGKNVANPVAMLLACAAVLEQAGHRGQTHCFAAAEKLRKAIFSTTEDGIRTFDLAGEYTTSQVVDEVVRRMKA